MGVDPRAVEPDRAVKSIGHEETYTIDRRDPDGLRREVLRMADAVATRLRGASLTGRTVQLKVRFADFRTITRARTVDGPLRTGPAVCDVAWALLDAVDVAPGVRLLGVSVSSLVADGQLPGEQLRLDLGSAGSAAATGPLPAPPDRTAPSAPTTGPAAATGVRPVTPEPPRWDAATGAIDAVRARFGPTAVGPAVLLAGDG
jgi:DNA polymerase-4